MDTINHDISLGKLVILKYSNETRVNRFIKGRYFKYRAGIPPHVHPENSVLSGDLKWVG